MATDFYYITLDLAGNLQTLKGNQKSLVGIWFEIVQTLIEMFAKYRQLSSD